MFKVLNDPSNPQTGDQARSMSSALEWISMVLTSLNVFLATFVQVRVWKHVRDGEEDYRVRMLKRKLEELKQQQEDNLAGIVRAKRLADERAAQRAAQHSSIDMESDEMTTKFENPVAEVSSDDEESAKGGSGKGKGKE